MNRIDDSTPFTKVASVWWCNLFFQMYQCFILSFIFVLVIYIFWIQYGCWCSEWSYRSSQSCNFILLIKTLTTDSLKSSMNSHIHYVVVSLGKSETQWIWGLGMILKILMCRTMLTFYLEVQPLKGSITYIG